jgi:hypothetical protein
LRELPVKVESLLAWAVLPSQLTPSVTSTGASSRPRIHWPVGAIGFGSFRGSRDRPDDLIQRLRLVGEIFANALASKRANEALRAREQSLREARECLGKLAAKLLHA